MSAPSVDGAPAPGDALGPYRIVRWLGRGGMGTVYEAVDTVLERRVALKLIVAAHSGDPAFRAGLVAEARAQAALDSPHIVQVFAHGEVDGRLYIASQLVPDGDLGAALRDHGPLPPHEAAEVVAQVADGLAEAHRSGLAHRDIKPANVLLRRRGPETVAYLADFGIATAAGDGSGVRTDLEAMGRLLAACLTGRTPYDGRPVPHVPRRLARVLEAALAGRLSAAELREELRAAAAASSYARGRRRASLLAALAGSAAAVVLFVAPVALPAGQGPEPEAGRAAAGGAVAPLARSLEQDAALDPTTAACTARALAGPRAEAGDSLADLPVDAVLTAAARCLWP
ncbi:serine/threonine-protein kinase [Nocardioides sp. R1-1]|uniref:serine/threonine-protein kinase n=1 Tax=Nocardioides sp. R1-1 TaxID=3383502 RepID=UPI0038D0E25B